MRKKMMKGLISAGLLMAFASGCAYSWEKPGMTTARLLQDEKECIRYGERSYSWARSALQAGSTGSHGNSRTRVPLRSAEIQGVFINCMTARGYEAKYDSPGVKLATAPPPREGKTGSR